MHVIAAKAVAFGEALRPEFKTYTQKVIDNTQALAAGLMQEGFHLVSGSTDNHLVLVDLRSRKVNGKEVELALDDAAIHTNKNMIPYDPAKPNITSGIRLGTPAITTRGFGLNELKQVSAWIGEIARDVQNEALQERIHQEVRQLCPSFPLPT